MIDFRAISSPTVKYSTKVPKPTIPGKNRKFVCTHTRNSNHSQSSFCLKEIPHNHLKVRMAKRVSPAATVDLNFEAVERPKLGLADVTNRVHSTSNAERDSKRAKTVQTTSSEPLLVANEGEVHVVEAPIISPVPELGDIHDGNTDEDLELVGTRNALTLPHPRHDCAMHRFMLNAADSDQQGIQNERHCELCHCLAQNWHLPRSFCDMHSICRLTFRSPYSRFNQFEVCDAPVKDCKVSFVGKA